MANKSLNAIITIGGALSGTLGSAIGGARRKLGTLNSTIGDLEKKNKALGKSMNDALRNGGQVGDLHRQYRALGAEIDAARRKQERLTGAMRGMDRGKSMMGAGATAIGTAAAVASIGVLPVVQAASFEKAMLGVAKQVQGARDENGKLTQTYFDMRRQIQQLGREIPIATNEIANMVAAGARMGVANDQLIEFTRTSAMMASAFDLPADELAEQMGKIAGLFKIPIPAIGGLADAINYLDDNAISKGQDIIDFLTRTGGVAGSVHVTGKEMAALGSTLLTLGERSETASTATNALFQKLAAAEKGTKKFQNAIAELGLSTAHVQKGMQIDSQGTILEVLDAVNKLPKDQRLGILVDMVGLEHSDTIAKLSGNLAEYRKQIDLVNNQKVEGSMSREFAATLASTNAQWEIMKNRAREVGVNIGSVLLPSVNQAMGAIGSITSKIADFSREHPVLTKNILLVSGVLIGSVAVWGAVTSGVGAATFAFNALKLAVMTNPIGLALVAISAAAVLIWQNWEPISGFFKGLWRDVTDAAESAWEWYRDTLLPFSPLGPIIQNWGPIIGFFGTLWGGVKSVTGAVWGFIKRSVLDYSPLGLVIKNWQPLSRFFGNLFDGIKATVRSSIDWILRKIAVVGDAWQAAKRALGMKAEGEFSASTMWKVEAATPPRPKMPPMATARGRGPAFTDNSSHTYHIVQRPGQDGKALAKDVADERDRRRKPRSGGQLYDAPRGY